MCFHLQHNLGGGEAPAEGEEQDGDEEAGHRFLGLRWLRRSSAQSKEPHVLVSFSFLRLLAPILFLIVLLVASRERKHRKSCELL